MTVFARPLMVLFYGPAFASGASALAVLYSLDGKAVDGTDYASLSGSVIIPAGADRKHCAQC